MGIRGKFEEAKHPRGFGGKFGHGTGTKVAPKKAPAPSKYSAAQVTSGSAMKKRPPPVGKPPSPTAPKPALEPGKVHSSDYGMHYDPANEKVVAAARTVPDEKWDLLPVESLPAGTPIEANEAELKRKHIDKVVSGEVPFREGYVTKMWRAPDGRLHVVDGHHRVAMYAALRKDMPVRIMDPAILDVLKSNPI